MGAEGGVGDSSEVTKTFSSSSLAASRRRPRSRGKVFHVGSAARVQADPCTIGYGFCRIHYFGVLRWAAGWRLAGACGGSAGGLKLRWTTECMCWLDAAIASLGSTRTARRHASPGGGLEAPSEPSAQRLREGVRACEYGRAATSEALRACRPNGWGRPERLERWRGEGRPWRSVTRSPRSTGWFCSGVPGANRGCGIGSWSR